MKFKINISKKGITVLFVALFISIIIGLYAIAEGDEKYANAPAWGHGSDEVFVKFGENELDLQTAVNTLINDKTNMVAHGRTRHDTIIPIPGGYDYAECVVIVTIEDAHYGDNKATSFYDPGSWSDNHYGGFQAYASPTTDNKVQITCRAAITYKNDEDPHWFGTDEDRCQYVIFCRNIVH